MTIETFALNTELRPLLEALATLKGAPLWAELIPAGEQITGRDGRSWINDNPGALSRPFRRTTPTFP